MITIDKERVTKHYTYLGEKRINLYIVRFAGLNWQIENAGAGQYEFTLHHHRGKIEFLAGSLHEALTMIIDWDILPRVSDMPRICAGESIMRQIYEHNKESHHLNRYKVKIDSDGEIEVTNKLNVYNN